jgi:nicotinamidase-related amidase
MRERAVHRLDAHDTTLLVIDLQEKLLPKIAGADGVLAASLRMIQAAHVLHLPIVVTEQYPAGIGRTVGAVREALGKRFHGPFEKTAFSCCGCEAFLPEVQSIGRGQLVMVGIEAHVCVQQTALDVVARGYVPFVCVDATGSRATMNRDVAIERMRDAGAVITTTEAVIFELAGRAGTDTFKQLLPLVR